MDAAGADKWLESARRSQGAARLLHGNATFVRSSVSRYYFAAYAAAHAVLLHLGKTPPQQGNWSHKGLPDVLRTVLTAIARVDNSAAYSQMLRTLYDLRVVADYGAGLTLDATLLESARRDSGRVVKLAERMADR